MKFKIIFEDDQVLVIDKPSGLVVNRSETIKEKTLQDQLSEYFQLRSDLGIGDRAGIVHRLDRETSGLLLVAKTQKTFENLQAQFKSREVKKEYLALVHGQFKEKIGSIEFSVGRIGKFGKFGRVDDGRESMTDYQVDKEYIFKQNKFDELILFSQKTKSRINYLNHHAKNYTLIKLYPATGRTHQIRVHTGAIGHPVVSDLIYTPKKILKFDLDWCPRLFLHASRIEFKHPTTTKTINFQSPLPKDLEKSLKLLTIDN